MGHLYEGLWDHEGFVERESTIINPLLPEHGHWVGHYCETLDGTFTGRIRAACGCGWRGPTLTAKLDSMGFVPEAVEDDVLEVWSDTHIAPLQAQKVVPSLYVLLGVLHALAVGTDLYARQNAAEILARFPLTEINAGIVEYQAWRETAVPA